MSTTAQTLPNFTELQKQSQIAEQANTTSKASISQALQSTKVMAETVFDNILTKIDKTNIHQIYQTHDHINFAGDISAKSWMTIELKSNLNKIPHRIDFEIDLKNEEVFIRLVSNGCLKYNNKKGITYIGQDDIFSNKKQDFYEMMNAMGDLMVKLVTYYGNTPDDKLMSSKSVIIEISDSSHPVNDFIHQYFSK